MQKPNQQLSQEERAKRQAVYLKKPDRVLVKFYDWKGALQGLSRVTSAELAERKKKMDDEATKRNLNPHAYRDKRDTGLQVLAKEANVSLTSFYQEMKADGYVFAYGEFTVDESRDLGAIVTLAFERNGNVAVHEPEWIATVLGIDSFYIKALWANLNYTEDGSSIRVDTINTNIAKPRPGTRKLRMHGNTYRIGD